MNHRVLTYINTFLWVTVTLVLVVIYAYGDINSLPIELVYEEICDKHANICSSKPDSILIAVQLGRLDFIATALAILGVGVGALAIFGFLFIKEKSEIEARAAAQTTAKTEIDDFLEKQDEAISKNVDALLAKGWTVIQNQITDYKEVMGLVDEGSVSQETGDDIADSFEKGEENDND